MSLMQTWDGPKELSGLELPLPKLAHTPPTAFSDVVSAFFRNRKGIVAALLVFFVCVTALLTLSHKTYESRLVYMVRSEGADFPITSFDSQGSVAQMASELVTDTQIGTEVELLSDTELHRKILATLQPQATAAKIEGQLLTFNKHLKILPVPKTTLISVTYNSKSKADAIATLAALNQQYLASRAAIRGSEKAFAFFDSEASRYYQQLQKDQQNLASFEKNNHVTLLDEEKDLATHQLAETRGLLNENESAQAEASRKLIKMMAEHESLPGRIETQKRELPDQVSEGHLNSLLIDLENKRQELLTKYHETDRHVQEVDQQILNTREGLEKVGRSQITEIQTDINPIRASIDSDLEHLKIQTVGLNARQKALESQVASYGADLQRLDQITAQHDDLVRSIRQDEQNYELYSKRREEARIDKTLDGNKIANIVLVSGPAINPEPLAQQILAVASVYLIGSVLIIGIGVLSGLWSPRFHAPWEVEAAASAPVLATIPLVDTAVRAEEQQRPFTKPPRAAGGRDPKDGLKPTAHQQIGRWLNGSAAQVLSAPAASTALSRSTGRSNGIYSALIERLRRTSSSRPGGLAFAVTSSIRGEGVSHVVHSLAEDLQRYTGKRVAVVAAPEGGHPPFAQVLSGPTEIEGSFLESGEESIRNWLRRLRETNDYVLIDCPSMEESHSAVILGRESDGLLMVVGAGDATRIQLRGSMAALSLASVPLVGIAMNKRSYPIPELIYRAL